MKLKDLFIGKLVKGVKGKVMPVEEQDDSDEPIGYIQNFSYFYGKISPIVHWIGQDHDYDHPIDIRNITDVEE